MNVNIHFGWPGKVHDARVFVNSSFCQQAGSGKLFSAWTRTIKEIEVPLVPILGDPANPLLPWLMKPFQENPGTSPEERNFNYRQSRAKNGS